MVCNYRNYDFLYRRNDVEPYGFFSLVALMITGVLGTIIGPPIMALERMLVFLVGI